MRFADSSPTVKLATARLEFSRDRRSKQALRAAAVLAVILGIVNLARPLYLDGTGLATLRERNAALQADLARVRMELELERSTRASLERQVAELNRETSQLKNRLDFFNAQSGRPDRAP
jgi:septal ring factor EnvC (AmiA/AmiB activator)